MFLILHIIDRHQAVWLVYAKGKIKFLHKFITEPGEENILFNLDKFLRKNKINLKKFLGFGLVVDTSSLTQVKLITTIINTMGWNYQKPVEAIFYQVKADGLEELVKSLTKQKKFKQIKVKYQSKPEITISNKKNKFKLVK